MNEPSKTRQFRWALILAWVPLVPMMYGCFNSFRGISEQKATGLAAVAGGFMEFVATFGLLALVATEVYAIVVLVRSVSGGSFGRSVLSLLSLVWCVCVLLYVGFAVWLVFIHRPFAT